MADRVSSLVKKKAARSRAVLTLFRSWNAHSDSVNTATEYLKKRKATSSLRCCQELWIGNPKDFPVRPRRRSIRRGSRRADGAHRRRERRRRQRDRPCCRMKRRPLRRADRGVRPQSARRDARRGPNPMPSCPSSPRSWIPPSFPLLKPY